MNNDYFEFLSYMKEKYPGMTNTSFQVRLEFLQSDMQQSFFRDYLRLRKIEIQLVESFLDKTDEPFGPDHIWLWGKYKGMKLEETPQSYLRWALSNMDLTLNQSKVLKETLDQFSL